MSQGVSKTAQSHPDRLTVIKDYLDDGFFFDNPNESDVRDEIQWMIDEIETRRKRADKWLAEYSRLCRELEDCGGFEK